MLILEAGDDHMGEAVIDVPAEVGAVIGNPNYDWVGRLIPFTLISLIHHARSYIVQYLNLTQATQYSVFLGEESSNLFHLPS